MTEPKEYSKMRKKYKNLPRWEWLEKNFYFKPEDGQILAQVKRNIFEKLESITEDMESLLAVGESLESFYERKMLTQQEREKLFEVYKTIKSLLWSCNKITIEYNERQHADWIVSAKKSWEKIKPDIGRLCDKLSQGWKTYEKPGMDTSYHG